MRSRMSTVAALTAALMASCAYADTPQGSVLTYNTAFFADARPNTAYDMIGRLPGFTFNDGNSARGFAGTASNVLIDGQRPTSKSDDVQTILTRIPASDVDHVEVIRGGAPGIDMQGYTVVANVIRKTGSSTQWVLDVSDNFFMDGHTVPGASLNFTEHTGASTFEASITRYAGYDDSVGWGTHTVTFYNPDGTIASSFVQRAHTTGQGSGGALTGAATISAFRRHVQSQPCRFRIPRFIPARTITARPAISSSPTIPSVAMRNSACIGTARSAPWMTRPSFFSA